MTRFTQGEAVRIREDFPPGHIRTPVYLRGKQGAFMTGGERVGTHAGIGGYTGDCLGAAQQSSELVFLLGMLACKSF